MILEAQKKPAKWSEQSRIKKSSFIMATTAEEEDTISQLWIGSDTGKAIEAIFTIKVIFWMANKEHIDKRNSSIRATTYEI